MDSPKYELRRANYGQITAICEYNFGHIFLRVLIQVLNAEILVKLNLEIAVELD